MLDRPEIIYFPGQTVTGKVDFWINRNKKVTSISLVASAEARVRWIVRRSGGKKRRSRRIVYESQEAYFTQKIQFVGGVGYSFEMTPFNYVYPFSFTLPQQLPSSFEGTYGCVRFTLKAAVERPNAKPHVYILPFTVNGISDLNYNPPALQPIDMHKSKRLWCCCCASGRIKARVWTEHAGVVPGQTLYLKMDIDNQSGRRLQSVTVKLIQFVRYIGRRRDWLSTSTQHRETSNILLEKTLDKTQVEDWSNIGIKIPPVVPSDLPYCNIIHVHYQVLVALNPGFWHCNLNLKSNLIIGNVPLRQMFSHFTMPNPSAVQPTAMPLDQPSAPLKYPNDSDGAGPSGPMQQQVAPAVPSAPWLSDNQYTDLPPPTYTESVFMANMRSEEDDRSDTESQHEFDGPGQFAPRYVTYGTKNQ